jgi:hypothetical protein
MHEAPAVDNTDWLKTVAIILVVVDHTGYFFIENAQWWSVFGRMAAPPFFFLMGYAHTRTVPFHWIWLGIILTVLDSSNSDWTWMAPNILLSFAFIRLTRPYVEIFVQRYDWLAFGLLVLALIAVLPITANLVDYGAEGWLWALFGFSQRIYVDGRLAAGVNEAALSPPPAKNVMTADAGLTRLLTCFAAAVIYIWQEPKDFAFSQVQLVAFILGVSILAVSLCLFRRGPSRIQPPEPIAGILRYIGRYTLEIYAIQLAGSEILIKFMPDLAP